MSGNIMETPRGSTDSGDGDLSKYVRLRLCGGGGGGENDGGTNSMTVMVRQNTLISKIKNSYCRKFDLSPHHLRFLHDGDRLNNDLMTLRELKTENGEYEIDVFQYQQSGGHVPIIGDVYVSLS